MDKNFFAPFTARGLSNISPPPPWHYAGDVLVFDFWARPEAAASLLPVELKPDTKAEGHAQAYFIDWQFTANSNEVLEPERYQYREFFILVDALFNEKPVAFCTYIFVDNDAAMARGWAQGFPKRLGSVAQTRAFNAKGPAATKLEAGSQFGATAATQGQRIAKAVVTLEKPVADPATLGARPTLNMRHFPSLVAGQWERPAVHQLVESVMDNLALADVWMGKGELILPKCEGEEVSELAPVRCGNGYRMCMSYSVTDLKTLVDHSAK